MLACAFGLAAGLLLARPVNAAVVTWNLVDVTMGGTNVFKFTGSFAADASTGLVQWAHMYEQYFSDTPIELFSDAGAVIRTDLNSSRKFVIETGAAETALVGFHQVTLLLNVGATFADDVATLPLDGNSAERTNGCCSYLSSGSLANAAIAVPEPASMALFGIGAGALGMTRRRKA